MTIVVSDTSPIRALDHLKLLDLPGVLFDRVLVPPGVLDELENPKAGFAPVAVRNLPFFGIAAPQDQARVNSFQPELEPGEAQAIALALEVNAAAVLIDE